ncbi:hypothetical protein [Aquimarina spongiae]|uniref:Uncharacterized protein n=1 Tax=Aquimarina spongiae TaxID=570521 RepID=A0A1M6JEI8_9FLAO|nr:hypothetical protein [Aquimarina spongiae]SHJ45143.1 hypothetical protein SAMN04488508_10926 [Aquimarina spongiae]
MEFIDILDTEGEVQTIALDQIAGIIDDGDLRIIHSKVPDFKIITNLPRTAIKSRIKYSRSKMYKRNLLGGIIED